MPAPEITPLPPAPSRLDEPGTFTNTADAFLSALPGLQSEVNAVVEWMGDTVTEVSGKADEALESAKRAAFAVPFQLRLDLLAASGAADGYGATVTAADTETHTAVSGEVALGGAAATVGASIPNEGRYTRVSGAWLRTGDTDRQGGQAWAEDPGEPGGAGTKSAKGWAETAKETADAIPIVNNPTYDIIGTTPDGVSFKFAIRGANSKVVAGIDTSLRWIAAGGFYAPTGKSLTLGFTKITDADANYAWAIRGFSGKPLVGLGRRDQTFYVQNLNVAGAMTVGGADLSSVALATADTANIARARGVSETPHNVRIVRIGDKANNLIVGLGQSLMTAQECWPYLPRTAESRTFMMGSSVRPSTFNQPGFTPQGSAVLNALVSTVEAQTNTSRTPLSDAAIAALSAGNGAEGESILTAAVRQLARGYADQRGDLTPAFVAANAAVSGRTIEALSKGASPDLYSRGTGALTALKGIVDPGGTLNNYQVAAAIIAQGEWNYNSTYGGTQDYTTYLNLLKQLRTDYNADWAAVSGQTEPPAWLTYVTSGNFVIDSVNMAISNAQVDFALSTPGVWCFGPAYAVNDKGGHLQPNGSRWMGAMAGKVLRKVMVERLGFEPLTPVRITSSGQSIFVHFATTTPLQFQPCYVGSGTSVTSTTYSAYGFRVSDDAGALTITNVSIVGSTIVRIDVSRALSTNPFVWYASAATGGNGNLCNSDPTRSDDVFEFLTSLPGNPGGSGMYASENIAALVNNPYPLWDWCVPFRRAVGYSR